MIICIFGEVRSGKTMLMTYFIKLGYLSNYEIYTNYLLNDMEYTPIKTIDQLKKLTPKNKKLWGWDEIWITADSRTSGSTGNKSLSEVVLQSGKAKADLIYTTQNPNIDDKSNKSMQFDLRIRDVTSLFLRPHVAIVNENDIPVVLTVEVFNRDFDLLNVVDIDVTGIHKLYDTYQKIEATPIQDDKILYNKYKNFMGSRKKLKSILIIDEHMKATDADNLASYIVD